MATEGCDQTLIGEGVVSWGLVGEENWQQGVTGHAWGLGGTTAVHVVRVVRRLPGHGEAMQGPCRRRK